MVVYVLNDRERGPCRARYGKLDLSELRELHQLGDENARLRRLEEDLSLCAHILVEFVL